MPLDVLQILILFRSNFSFLCDCFGCPNLQPYEGRGSLSFKVSEGIFRVSRSSCYEEPLLLSSHHPFAPSAISPKHGAYKDLFMLLPAAESGFGFSALRLHRSVLLLFMSPLQHSSLLWTPLIRMMK